MKLRRHKEEPEVSTESLNDIMFFLLLFFLIVATFANPNVINLLLPKAQATQSIAKKQVTLSITKDKQYYIEKRPVAYEALESELNAFKGQMEDVTIVVRTDYSLTVQDLVDVLSIGAKLKIKMILATDKK